MRFAALVPMLQCDDIARPRLGTSSFSDFTRSGWWMTAGAGWSATAWR